MPQFDVAAAKKAGYSDSEIADFLASQKGFDAPAAREAGYGDAEIVSQLSSDKAQDFKASDDMGYDPKTMIGRGPRSANNGSRDPEALRAPTAFRGYDPEAMADKVSREGLDKPAVMGGDLLDKSWQGAAARTVAEGLAPTTASLIGSRLGMIVGAPAGPWGAGAGAIAGGLGGGFLGKTIQDALLRAYPETAVKIGLGEAQRQVDATQHPVVVPTSAAALGFLSGGAGGGAKNLTQAVMQPLLSGAIGGTFEAANEAMSGQKLNPAAIAGVSGLSALQYKPWNVSNMAGSRISDLENMLLRTKGVDPADARRIATDLAESGNAAVPADLFSTKDKANFAEIVKNAPRGPELAAKYGEDTLAGAPKAGQTIAANLAPTDVRTAEQAALGAERTGERVGRARTQNLEETGFSTSEVEGLANRYLTDNVRGRAGELAPSAGTRADLAAESEAAVKVAGEAATPEVRTGSAGSRVSDRLNAERDEAWSGVNKAYDDARNMGEAFVAPESGNEIIQSFEKALEPAKRRYKTEIPSTMNILGYASELVQGGKPKIQDLFDVRSDLTAIMADKAGTPDAAAAREMRTALDKVVDDLDAGGMIVGDPDAVSAWRNAIGSRREFGRRFEGNDIVERATQRTRIGGEEAIANAPEDLENLIFGKGSVSGSKGMVRNLTALKGRLPTEDWDALRQAGVARIFGKDAGGENFGKAYAKFRKENPDLADLLFTPDDVSRMSGAQEAIKSAVSKSEALTFGSKVLLSNSDEFSNSLKAMSPEELASARVSGRQAIMDDIQSPEGSRRLAKALSTNEGAQANIRALFGDKGDDLINMATFATKLVNNVSDAKNLLSIPAGDFTKTVSSMTPAIKQSARVVVRDMLKSSTTTPQKTLSFMENVAKDTDLQSRIKTLFGEREGSDLIANAVKYTGRKVAQSTGSGIMSANPTDFANSVSTMSKAALRDARVTGRQKIRDAMNNPAKSEDMLNQIATQPDSQANIIALFGPDEGESLIRSATAVSKKLQTAAELLPKSPKESGADTKNLANALIAFTAGARMGPAIAVNRFLENLGMTTAKANQVVLEAFDPAKTDEVIAMIEKNYGKNAASRFAKRIANVMATQDKKPLIVNKVTAIGSVTSPEPEKSEDKAKPAEEPQASLSQDYNVPWMARIIRGHEGLGDNPKSSAVGPFQFIDSTLASMYNKEHPNDTPITDKEAAAMRADGRISRDDMERYGEKFTEDNVQRVLDAGFPVTVGNVYLMHFAGEGAGPKVLKALEADPNTPVTAVLSSEAINDNANIKYNGKYLKDFTVQDFSDWAEDSMGASFESLVKSGEIEG